jgi:glyoxylase-like metal-dependent hydrolase (beta-lactamase superfamily II)
MKLTQLFNNLFIFNDYVNVYAITHENRAVLIDFGSGDILNHLPEINIDTIDYILHTHYHRDQCFGDKLAIEHGIKIGGPKREKKLFNDAENFWKTKSYYDIYFFKPTFFTSTYNIPLDVMFETEDSFDWGPYRFKIIDTRGHTKGSISYLVEIDGKKLAFTGDLIHSGGKVITYYDLQYYYNDNGENGIVRSFDSFKRLLSNSPDILLPSHGNIIEDPQKDVKILEDKFERARIILGTEWASIEHSMSVDLPIDPGIPPVSLKDVFPSIIHKGFSPPYLIKGGNQNCILIDFAGCSFFGFTESDLDGMLKDFNIKTIDFVIPTHYHDDHTAGFSRLQKKYHLKIYALENIVDILENPTHYRIGCLTETPIKVDRVLKDGESLEWDKYKFKVYHFPGQTEYHMGLFTEIDGKSIFFTGDSVSPRMFADRHNNVNSINFCRLGKDVGYMKCADILLECNPEYLAISHVGIIKVNRELLKKYKETVSEYEPILSEIIAQENPNMGYDPNWISFKPIRIITKPGENFDTNLIVRNYTDKQARVELRLNLPNNWSAEYDDKSHSIESETFKEIPITISIPQNADSNGRTILTANIKWNGTNLGPFPDLMIDHGYKPSYEWTGWTPDKKENLLNWIVNHMMRDNNFYR